MLIGTEFYPSCRTSSAGLNDNNLWFIIQSRTILWVQMGEDFLNKEVIIGASIIGTYNGIFIIDFLPVRHYNHEGAVRVFMFGKCSEVPDCIIYFLWIKCTLLHR